MLAPPDQTFIEALRRASGLPYDYVLHQVAGERGVREGRLVGLRLISYEAPLLDVSALDALERVTVTGHLRRLELGESPRLVELDVCDTLLESLDVTSLPALATLKVSRTKLMTLPDLPDSLTTLECDSVPLGSLALRLPKLNRLIAPRCGLAALDVAGIPALTSLDCAFNAIRSLDLGALSQLEVLWCQGNGATVALPDGAPLRTLVLGRNPRAELDATAFPALATLLASGMGLEQLRLDNPALVHLDCADNRLAALDLARAPGIRILKAQGNRLHSLDIRPLHRVDQLEVETTVEVACTELQKHTLLPLRTRFGLPKPTKAIAKMDAFQLHAFVQRYNWDDGEKRLLEVIRHPACSLATALLVYWQSEPGELAPYRSADEAPRGERNMVALLREIETGVSKGRFARGPIPFDVHDVGGVDLGDDDPGIPDVMRQPA